MKVIAINGSARGIKGNTQIALELIKEELHKEKIEMEIIPLAEKDLHPCLACYKCKGTNKCIQNDDINAIYQKLMVADGIILGSPTYFSNITSRMAMFIERTGILSRVNGDTFKGKVGTSIAVARRAGANVVYSALNYFFGISQMPIVSSSYWNIILAREAGDIKKDDEGIKTLQTLAINYGLVLKKLRT